MKDISRALFGDAEPAKDVASLRLGEVVREYIKFYAEGATHTARAKQLDVDKFLAFLAKHRAKGQIDHLLVKHWDFSSTQRFIDESLRIGEAPATVARRLATLKHMGRMLAEKLSGFINPAREVKSPRMQLTRPKSIRPAELEEIREHASKIRAEKRTFKAVRNETLLNLLLDTGLRADEVRAIKMSQLDEKLGHIDQVRTKGRRFRTIYVTTEMRPRLKEYLEARAHELKRFFPTLGPGVNAKLPLFVSTYGASAADFSSFEMSPKSIWRAIRSCSVDTNLHPHLLRHTFASELLDSSHDIRLVAQALGHSDVRITMRYTERSSDEVAAALEQARKERRSRGGRG
jgi:site-specific recombinase XerD